MLRLRKQRVEKVVLFGPAGNLCVEARQRDFLGHGFEVALVRDATAGTSNEQGYQVAMVNFRFLAHAVWTTEEAERRLHEAAGRGSQRDGRRDVRRSAD